MPVPTFEEIILPLLQSISDKKKHAFRDIKETLATYFELTERERNELTPNGNNRFGVNISWAKAYMKYTELLEQIDQDSFKITDSGLETLKSNPQKIDRKYLEEFDRFVTRKQKKFKKKPDAFNLLIRYSPQNQRIHEEQRRWNDVMGREYSFKDIPNYKKIQPDTSVVWFHTYDHDLYFWGFGSVRNVLKVENGILTAVMKDFHFFDQQHDENSGNDPQSVKCPPTIQEQIKKSSSWNASNSIIQIDKDIFNQISKIKAPPIFDYTKLPFPSSDSLRDARIKISEEMLVDDNTLNHIFSTLLSGRNILLVGPVGSGKTNLATILPEIGWQEFGGYFSEVYTATADWTTQDVIGGIYPKLDRNKQITYSIQRGCVSETIYENLPSQSEPGKRKIIEKTINGKIKKYRGVWLVVDEFNRANMDRAFGQLFTALEYGTLKIPTTVLDRPFEELHIPRDYRIIGTLNTADKHFLHTLSDALKRRFAIIDLPVPTYDKKDLELYHIVRKSLLGLEKKSTSITIDLSTKKIQQGSDPQAEATLNTLYRLMLYIRGIKPLGTALLITMFRFMITYHHITKDWQKGLDLALTSTILPQLESLPYWTLNVIREVFCNDVSTFFKAALITDADYEKYMTDFKHLIDFLKQVGHAPSSAIKKFKTKSLTDEDHASLNPWDEEVPKPVLPLFWNAITAIIEEKGFKSEIEYE